MPLFRRVSHQAFCEKGLKLGMFSALFSWETVPCSVDHVAVFREKSGCGSVLSPPPTSFLCDRIAKSQPSLWSRLVAPVSFLPFSKHRGMESVAVPLVAPASFLWVGFLGLLLLLHFRQILRLGHHGGDPISACYGGACRRFGHLRYRPSGGQGRGQPLCDHLSTHPHRAAGDRSNSPRLCEIPPAVAARLSCRSPLRHFDVLRPTQMAPQAASMARTAWKGTPRKGTRKRGTSWPTDASGRQTWDGVSRLRRANSGPKFGFGGVIRIHFAFLYG